MLLPMLSQSDGHLQQKGDIPGMIGDVLFAHQYFYFYILAPLLGVELRNEPQGIFL